MAHFYNHFKDLLFNEKWSDFTVVCGGERIPIHRAVVCPQSKFFEKALSGGFVEALTGEVNLPEDDLQTFRKFLTYLYTGNYGDEEPFTSIMADWARADINSDKRILRHREEGSASLEARVQVMNDSKRPSSETNMTDVELEEALKEHRFPNVRRFYEPSAEGAHEVYEALRVSVNRDPAQYRGMIDGLIRCLFSAIEMYVVADKFMVDRLRLLARNRFDRACLTLLHEALGRHSVRAAERRIADRKTQAIDESAADPTTSHEAVMKEIYDTVAEAIDELYNNTPPGAIVRGIACFYLKHFYPGAHIGGRGKKDYFNKQIAAVVEKHPDLAEGITETWKRKREREREAENILRPKRKEEESMG